MKKIFFSRNAPSKIAEQGLPLLKVLVFFVIIFLMTNTGNVATAQQIGAGSNEKSWVPVVDNVSGFRSPVVMADTNTIFSMGGLQNMHNLNPKTGLAVDTFIASAPMLSGFTKWNGIKFVEFSKKIIYNGDTLIAKQYQEFNGVLYALGNTDARLYRYDSNNVWSRIGLPSAENGCISGCWGKSIGTMIPWTNNQLLLVGDFEAINGFIVKPYFKGMCLFDPITMVVTPWNHTIVDPNYDQSASNILISGSNRDYFVQNTGTDLLAVKTKNLASGATLRYLKKGHNGFVNTNANDVGWPDYTACTIIDSNNIYYAASAISSVHTYHYNGTTSDTVAGLQNQLGTTLFYNPVNQKLYANSCSTGLFNNGEIDLTTSLFTQFAIQSSNVNDLPFEMRVARSGCYLNGKPYVFNNFTKTLDSWLDVIPPPKVIVTGPTHAQNFVHGTNTVLITATAVTGDSVVMYDAFHNYISSVPFVDTSGVVSFTVSTVDDSTYTYYLTAIDSSLNECADTSITFTIQANTPMQLNDLDLQNVTISRMNDIITIRSKDLIEVKIYSIDGKICNTANAITSQSVQLPNNGIYIVRILNKGKIFYKKI
jgi:hypothetical protein